MADKVQAMITIMFLHVVCFIPACTFYIERMAAFLDRFLGNPGLNLCNVSARMDAEQQTCECQL